MRIVCISDTHNEQWKLKLPIGDMLIVAGDLTSTGNEKQLTDFNAWLSHQPFKYKVVIAGNHDFIFEKEPGLARQLLWSATHYLENSGCEIEGIKIWGSPNTPWFYSWAFNTLRGPTIKRYWELIPKDTDILITHGPPHGILDETQRGEFAGCEELRKIVFEISPKLHVFGHIHEGSGNQRVINNNYATLFVNAAVLDHKYNQTNKIQIVEYLNNQVKIIRLI